MTRIKLKAAVCSVAALAMVLGPAAAADKRSRAAAEGRNAQLVSSAADGGAAFLIVREATCDDFVCRVDFGKKDKVRTITAVSCFVISRFEPAFLGRVLIGDEGAAMFMPVASTNIDDNVLTEVDSPPEFRFGTGVFTYFEDFSVPAKTRLAIEMETADAQAGSCSITGTLG